ncbi:MAG: recombinase family protein, partial [Peptococcaceae bacterium]|nr:recombinase family protein [Peptococcaceae bacterium]
DTEKSIENMLNAIQAGIVTSSTKQRLESLENEKVNIEKRIVETQLQNPVLSREQIEFYLERFKTVDITDEDERQRLIDSFVNAVYLYDDKLVLTFNYKDGTKTISLNEINGSDLGSSSPFSHKTA